MHSSMPQALTGNTSMERRYSVNTCTTQTVTTDAIFETLPWGLKLEKQKQKTVQVSAMYANQLHTYIHTFPMEP